MIKTSPLVGQTVCNGRYRIQKRLGAGSFGEIFKAVDVQTNEAVAVKVEPSNTAHPQLLSESRFYSYLLQGAIPGTVGGGCKAVHSLIPKMLFYVTEGNYNIMVMDLLGSSLENIFDYCHNRLSLKTTVILAEQMITAIEYVHSRYIIHRDIKPDNFVIGTGKHSNNVYLIDFGLAKRYRLAKNSEHIPYKDGKSLTGTARYCSINTHLGIEQSRRDDLEGIAYILIYFLHGSLPWQGIKAASKDEKYALIAQTKMATPVEVLCRGLPVEFASFLNYTRTLEFEEKPDYGYIKGLFRFLFVRLGYQRDGVFDWTIRKLQEDLVERQRRIAAAAATAKGRQAEAAARASGELPAEEANTFALGSQH